DVTRTGRQGNQTTISADVNEKNVKATIGAQGQSEISEMVAPLPPVPFLAASFAISEQLALRANLAVGQSAKFTALRLGAGDSTTVTVTRFHADSLSLIMPDVALKLAVNAKGEVVGGTHLAQGWTVERKP